MKPKPEPSISIPSSRPPVGVWSRALAFRASIPSPSAASKATIADGVAGLGRPEEVPLPARRVIPMKTCGIGLLACLFPTSRNGIHRLFQLPSRRLFNHLGPIDAFSLTLASYPGIARHADQHPPTITFVPPQQPKLASFRTGGSIWGARRLEIGTGNWLRSAFFPNRGQPLPNRPNKIGFVPPASHRRQGTTL